MEGVGKLGYTGVLQQKADSNKKMSFNRKKEKPKYLKLRNLALFHVWEDAKSGLTEIIPLICTSAI